MTVGVWMVPVVLAAAVAFVWAAVWFEGLVAPPGYVPAGRTLEAADAGLSDTAVSPQFLGVAGQLDAEPHRPAA